MTPYLNTAATKLINERIKLLGYRKTQGEIATEAGFVNHNMMTYLKQGKNKVPLDRVPALAKALEIDAAYLMRLSLEQSVGIAAARAIFEIFGSPVTINEQAWLDELRASSDNSDPRMTSRSCRILRGIFGK